MFERCLYFNVNALARTVNRIWDQAFAEFDLSPSHAYLLRLVLSNPGLSPKQISEELKLEKSTVTRFLDVLEKKKLINRKKAVAGDARGLAVFPSTAAEKISQQLEKTGNTLYKKMQKMLGEAELKQLVSQLRESKQRLL